MLKTSAIAFFIGVAASPAFAAGNLINNGSFEDPSIGLPVSGFNYTSSVANWVTTGNATVLFNSAYRPVSDLLQAVQIERNGDQISQSFTTTIGQSYLVSFDLSSWWTSNTSNLAVLEVTAGPASQQFTADSNAYTTHTMSFVAGAGSTVLTFKNIGATGVSYPQLDNVSVTAVPEPGTYVMLLAGLAAVGFVAKRRAG